MRSGAGDSTSLLDRFARRVKDKVFVLRGGVWVDRAYDEAKLAPTKLVVEAWSPEYFALMKDHPELPPYLAFSARMIVVIDGRAYEVR